LEIPVTTKGMKKAFSLVEILTAIAIITVVTATLVGLIQSSENISVRAKIDGAAMERLCQFSQWVAEQPMSDFRTALNTYCTANGALSGTNAITINLSGASAANTTDGILQEPPAYTLFSEQGGFSVPYTVKLTISSPEGLSVLAAHYFQVGIVVNYSQPTLLGAVIGQSGALAQKSLGWEINKW